MRRLIHITHPGPLTTVQDQGRTGLGALGIPPSGACDRASSRLANRLVGNSPNDAVLEATLGGLSFTAETDIVVAVTGARPGGALPHNAPIHLRRGEVLQLGTPAHGLRTYVAIRGGISVAPVMGSRSTDQLSGLGPPPLKAGDMLPIGVPRSPMPGVDIAPVQDLETEPVVVNILRGPRNTWFTPDAWMTLTSATYTVQPDSNRIALRLAGPSLERCRTDELLSEPVWRGAIQVPPSGQPIIFLADHPVTGGYPIIGYVTDTDVDLCGQLRPGDRVRFRYRAQHRALAPMLPLRGTPWACDIALEDLWRAAALCSGRNKGVESFD